jgi:hypothetical protein
VTPSCPGFAIGFSCPQAGETPEQGSPSFTCTPAMGAGDFCCTLGP